MNTGPTNPGPAWAGPAGAAATGAVVIGLDLGGTKIAAALFSADGTVLARHTRPTPARDGAAAVLDALAAAAAEVDPCLLYTS
uniref:ROK family protein n=1 Tax=Streptomyces sp. wa13 TaxID=1828236 RepID=UPI003C7A0FE9